MAEHNYKGQLITYCVKHGLSYRFEEVYASGPSHDPRFTFHVFVNDERLGEGQDKKKKAAEKIAAEMALLSLLGREPPRGLADPHVAPSTVQSLPPQVHNVSNSSTEQSPLSITAATNNCVYDTNYIGKFNEFCQRKGWMSHSFVDECRGPPHLREFFCKVVIGERTFPEAAGKNKKEAKKNAALYALKVLRTEHLDDIQLQQTPGLEDNNVEQTGSSSAAESTGERSSSNQSSGSETSSYGSSDSQITFRSSLCESPVTPGRPLRRIELAANFTNQEKPSDVSTEDRTFLQDFDNITRLDSGGYGTVYRARKKLDKKYYVVKKVKRRSEKDVAEVQTLALLEHPHIVRYYHSWTGEDVFSENSCSGCSQSDVARHKLESLFIQMQWCANGTLERWLRDMEKVDKRKSLDIFRQVVDGVEYIHNKKLIHRDLKPANILFAEDMCVKIADFGLATPMSEKDDKQALLRTQGRGTEYYMAPEQETNIYENEVDIFPLGLILVELFWKFDNYLIKQKEPVIKLMLSHEPHKRPTASYVKKYFEDKALLHPNTR